MNLQQVRNTISTQYPQLPGFLDPNDGVIPEAEQENYIEWMRDIHGLDYFDRFAANQQQDLLNQYLGWVRLAAETRESNRTARLNGQPTKPFHFPC